VRAPETRIASCEGVSPEECRTWLDLFGFGVGWARPTNRPLFRSQYTLEVFYRFMLTPNFAITPDLQ